MVVSYSRKRYRYYPNIENQYVSTPTIGSHFGKEDEEDEEDEDEEDEDEDEDEDEEEEEEEEEEEGKGWSM
uniref:Uncharacterized protein n=1 Tax=Vespula pensylvanica TaxID=30213 RepID=A0A834UAZ1_VESPE|nr:hypothetical protein H0235_006806 [Vespula pensylvanica]